MHAEEAVYRKFLKIHKKCKHRPNDLFDLIVVRKYSGGEPGYMNSKPCEKCHAKLAKLKKKKIINKVYYSIESKTDELSNSIVEEHF